MLYSSLDQLIGRTPMLELHRFSPELPARILCKLEGMNPAGSVKDRAARAMLDDAKRHGKLNAQSVIIEPTSGNTGIGLCAVAAARGYRVIIVMPDSMSQERRMLMRAYGAELVLTPGAEGMKGAIRKANELARDIPGAFIPGQFDNPANVCAHEMTTGPEIEEDTNGQIDFFVAGVGTGGTLTGVGRYLKARHKQVKIIAVEPETSAVLSGCSAGAHGIQGIGAGFVPGILDTEIYDEVMTISDTDAFEAARKMGRKEGLLVGISSGAALAAAQTLALRPENAGKTIVVLLPDKGDRYLSTGLYAD